MLALLGILVVVAGFAVRANPLPVILLGALVTGVGAAVGPGVDLHELVPAALSTLEKFGTAFNDNRFFHITWLILPVIGLLERAGLQTRAKALISGAKSATTSQILVIYLALRQSTSALGLLLGGHAQMVRPLVAPMAEGAAERTHGPLPDRVRFRIRAMAAATDNIGLFFGEDIFIAMSSVVLIVGFLEQAGLQIEALHISVWAIPTAIVAFGIHAVRLLLLDRAIQYDVIAKPGA